ncbi:acetyltransferase [Corynebacterium glyciniphilum]|uniref:acetyltransferase n=1 Tax=Corynebacterium glyciniphilum TaxID=1404244 RepID=UPI003DA19310
MDSTSLRPCHGAHENPTLVGIWRSAVDATHDFLADADRDAIESALAAEYFPQLQLTVAELGGVPVGFAGTNERNLEMLFVDAALRGNGVGGLLLDNVLDVHGVRRVDVNEQNAQAVAFYRRRGFTVTGWDDYDDAGRPYPVLHMSWSAPH